MDKKGWAAVNQALDVTLYTIAEVCTKESNFVITSEMLADNPIIKIILSGLNMLLQSEVLN